MTKRFSAPIPLSLYIHIPWCIRKCPYCDFNSHESKTIPEDLYVKALLQDLDSHPIFFARQKLVSIFFGGGTPSLFSPKAIEKILNGVFSRFPFDSTMEITLEANPGTVDEKHFRGFKNAGINRLSIGIQSLQDTKLKTLGRIHNREYALRAIEAAQNAGFQNFNLDLMHGLPEQSLEDALADLNDALSFAPPHVSWYQLTIEPNTFFHHQPPLLPQEDVLYDIQEQGKKILLEKNYQHYEISAFAKKDHFCRHNRNYWEFGDYIGIGAGAHSKITNSETEQVMRYWQVKHPKDYLKLDHALQKTWHVVSEKDLIFEFMLNALRLVEGVPIALFTERTGLALNVIEPMLQQAREKQLLMNEAHLLRPTEWGIRFLNDLIGLFLVNEK